jgi:hypothetical protein
MIRAAAVLDIILELQEKVLCVLVSAKVRDLIKTDMWFQDIGIS